MRAVTKGGDEVFGANPECTSRHLNNHAGRTSAKSGHKRESNEAFSSTQADFYALSIAHDAKNGCQAIIHEVAKLDGLCDLIQHRVDREGDKLQVRKKGCPFTLWQREEDFVLNLLSNVPLTAAWRRISSDYERMCRP